MLYIYIEYLIVYMESLCRLQASPMARLGIEHCETINRDSAK